MSNVMEATSSPDEAGWFLPFGFNTDPFKVWIPLSNMKKVDIIMQMYFSQILQL